jgi:hypothetical protein
VEVLRLRTLKLKEWLTAGMFLMTLRGGRQKGSGIPEEIRRIRGMVRILPIRVLRTATAESGAGTPMIAYLRQAIIPTSQDSRVKNHT